MELNKMSPVGMCKEVEKEKEINLPNASKWNNSNIRSWVFGKNQDLIVETMQDHKVTMEGTEKSEGAATTSSEVKRKWWRQYLGISFAVLGSLVSALTCMMVKIMTTDNEEYHYNPITVAIWRFQGILWPALIVLLYQAFIRKEDVLATLKSTEGPGKWNILFFITVRNLLGLASLVLKYYALLYLNMADVTVIALSTPVFVTFVAYLLLGESCGFVPVFSALLTIFGVGIISRPPFLTGEKEFDANLLTGITFAFFSMVTLTLVFIVLRKLRTVNYMVIIALYGVTNTIVSLALTTVVHPFELPREAKHWLYAAGLAALAFILQCCLTLSLKFEEAGPVALIRTSDVIFAMVLQVFMGEYPDLYSYTGSTVVVTGILICVVRKWVSDLPEDHHARNRLSFLLI